MKCIQITISGDIYGKGMRFSVMHFANELGVNGFVQYNNRGEIVIEAEGGEEQLRDFTGMCREWAASLVVSAGEVHESENTRYTSFEIRHGLYGGGILSDNPSHPNLMKSFLNRVRRALSSGKQDVTDEIQ